MEQKVNNISSFELGRIFSLIGCYFSAIIFAITIIFAIPAIISIVFLHQLKNEKNNQNKIITASVLSIIFGLIFGLIGGIIMLINK